MSKVLLKAEGIDKVGFLVYFRGSIWLKDVFWRFFETGPFDWHPFPSSVLRELRDMYQASLLIGQPINELETVGDFEDARDRFEMDVRTLNRFITASKDTTVVARLGRPSEQRKF